MRMWRYEIGAKETTEVVEIDFKDGNQILGTGEGVTNEVTPQDVERCEALGFLQSFTEVS